VTAALHDAFLDGLAITHRRLARRNRDAEAIGKPRAIRAVANSCARSWFAFAVPCHRVLHKGGATAQSRRDGRQYRWVEYEAKLAAKRRG